ncbi:hypothetical protein [Roseisalinus antarcticus]|uniref:Uncharacterized protein n=1 Tax=Roseisalinus antarcticus TaxID=254357 RepID=A0A1Y5RPT9_9RHOB|nr:hypothetical protein [Roseisalinus antarcticus]SLN21403.1 hypothetical protein ROA7023_00557 [Roseisalinus antarcticus]
MSDAAKSDRSPLAASSRPETGGLSAVELVAAILSLVWVAGVGAFFFVQPRGEPVENLDSLRFVFTLMAIFMPVAMIWVAAAAARSARIMREESARLQAALDAMRKSYVEERQARGAGGIEASVERKLNEIAQAARKTESALATFTTARTPAAGHRAPVTARPRPEPQRDEDQPSLAFGTTAEDMAPQVSTTDLIRALNFPDTEEDEVGFAALRRALKDRSARHLIQASQDVLTLLSQDGIYMDDLRPDLARPEIWRQFASGVRGRSVAALGGVRDRSSLALAAGRMREDTIFRDAAHHFLRRYDQMLVTFEKTATDEEIVAMSDTRTSRAFMLLGRVTGTFD